MSTLKKIAKLTAQNLGRFLKILNQTDDLSIRAFVASRYLKGKGLEIGALDKPMPLPQGTEIKYLDRMSVPDLRKQYPDYKSKKLVDVDIVDDGQSLSSVRKDTFDFLIANHFLEHCPNPLLSLENMLRVIKNNGKLFLTIPDKRFTFDARRETTNFDHLLNDFKFGPENSKFSHFLEWSHLVENIAEPKNAEELAKTLIDKDYSIHFHVWTITGVAEIFTRLNQVLNYKSEIELIFKNGSEIIVIISKIE